MSNKPLLFSSICQTSQQLQQIAKRAKKIAQLNIILQEVLPSQLAGRCQLANIQNNKLIIHTENAAIASLLRFHSATLLKTFSSQLAAPLDKIEVKVKPDYRPRSSAKTNTLNMSDSNAALIAQTAAELDDGQLKTALHKLARRGQRTKSAS